MRTLTFAAVALTLTLGSGSATAGLKVADTDGDGVTDDRDACPKVAGPVENRGCPVKAGAPAVAAAAPDEAAAAASDDDDDEAADDAAEEEDDEPARAPTPTATPARPTAAVPAPRPAAPASANPRVAAAVPHLTRLLAATEALNAAVAASPDCAAVGRALQGWAAPHAKAGATTRERFDGARIVTEQVPLNTFQVMAGEVYALALSPADRREPPLAGLESRYRKARARFGELPIIERCADDATLDAALSATTMNVLSSLPIDDELDAWFQPPEHARALAAMTAMADGAERLAAAVEGAGDCAGAVPALDGWLRGDGVAVKAASAVHRTVDFPWREGTGLPQVVAARAEGIEARYQRAMKRVDAGFAKLGACDATPGWDGVADRLYDADLVETLEVFD